jgi:hypothetical protein
MNPSASQPVNPPDKGTIGRIATENINGKTSDWLGKKMINNHANGLADNGKA